MMRRVFLYGHLKKKFGGEFKFDTETAGEIIRALNVNLTGFMDELKKGSYRLVRGDRKKGMDLELGYVNELKLGSADFHLIPVAAGAKGGGSGGAIKAVLGVALIGAAIFFSGGTLAAPLAGMMTTLPGILGGVTYGNIAMLGVATALAGVSQILSPTPKGKDPVGADESFLFSGPMNVSEQAAAIPLVYGRVITGSVAISAGLDIESIL